MMMVGVVLVGGLFIGGDGWWGKGKIRALVLLAR
jgi:hypothetical protein